MTGIFECLSKLTKRDKKTSVFSGTENGKAIFRKQESLEGAEIPVFDSRFVRVIDTVILKNNQYLFTKEQEKFFEQYCKEAEESVLSLPMREFDKFLGNYKGEQ